MVELLVVLAIFTLLTSVVIFNYGRFNSETVMTNMAYELALATRQAQVFSLGVRGEANNDSFDNRYGIHINTTTDYGGTGLTKESIFFIDRDPTDNQCESDSAVCYACASGSECLESVVLTRDIFIDKICVSSSPDPVDNDGDCVDESVTNLNLTFERPNPDAVINGETGKNVAIVLKNSFDDLRAVIVRSTGQISVEVLNPNE